MAAVNELAGDCTMYVQRALDTLELMMLIGNGEPTESEQR